MSPAHTPLAPLAPPPTRRAARARVLAVKPAPTVPGAVAAVQCADAVLDVMPGVMDAMRGAMRRQVGEPLSVPQFRCLQHIALRPCCSVSDVAKFLGVTLPTASALIDRLVKAGCVAPTAAALDRRRTELQLTASGHALLGQIRQGARQDFARALASCTESELSAVHAGLIVLKRAFRNA